MKVFWKLTAKYPNPSLTIKLKYVCNYLGSLGPSTNYKHEKPTQAFASPTNWSIFLVRKLKIFHIYMVRKCENVIYKFIWNLWRKNVTNVSCAFILKIRLVEKYVILLYMTELTVQSDTKFAKVTKPEN